MQSERDRRDRSWASVAANANDAVYRVLPYHKSCDTAGYETLALIWEVRKCSSWDNVKKIATVRTLVADEWVLEVVCIAIAHPSL